MTPRDFSQFPVEQLARLLLERARHDPGLPRRSAANSNEAPPGWSAPPVAQPCRAWFPDQLGDQPRFAGQDRLEELVAQAMTAAQEAEELALATRAASRRANRGAAIAIALGTLGAITGMGAGLGNLLLSGSAKPPVQVAAQPTEGLQAATVPATVTTTQPGSAQPASAQPAGLQAEPEETSPAAAASGPTLAPATFVRVLPAVPSPSAYEPADSSEPPSQPVSRPGRRIAPRPGLGRVVGTLQGRSRAG